MSELLLSIIWFSFLYLGTFFLFKKKNLFHPVRFISLLYIIRNVFYLLVVYFDEEKFPARILVFLKMDLNTAVVEYTYVQTIAFICLVIGISFFRDKITPNRTSMFHNYFAVVKTANVCFTLGLLGYLYFLISIGGINFLLSNLTNRVELQSGQYSLIFMKLMPIAVIFRIKAYSFSPSKRNRLLFLVFFIMTALASSSLGGRKNTVFLILMCLISYHFLIKNFTFKNLKITRLLPGILIVSFYVFFIPALRSPDGFNKLLNGEIDVIEEVELGDLISKFSYTYIDIFCANHYNKDNIWYFSSLLTIPYNLDISKSNTLRPPIDEGVYFYNIAMQNLEYSPPTTRSKMDLVSLPIENFGFGYANLLIPGIILSFFMLGIVYKWAYNLFINSGKNPIILFLYMDVLFNFNFSSLRIINLISLIINLSVVFLIYRFLLISKKV